MQRRTIIRIALALVALAGSSEPALAAGASSPRTRAFSSGGVSFRYPTAWKVSPTAWRWTSSFEHLVSYLATQPMHDPCTRSSDGTTTCAPPIGALVSGAILVSWTREGTPGWTLAKQAGRRTTLAGRPAKVAVSRPGTCRYLGAGETVTAQIALAAKSSSIRMQACLRGSTTAANERRVLAMLATLHLR
ncbi:MAG: hypothetical protein ABI317_03525 [Gaiellales bacterium]